MQKRIMILEDEPLLTMLVEDMVGELGMLSSSPASRDAAFRAIDASPPDVVLLDVNLWGKDSTDLAEVLQAKRIPFVLMTGYDAASVRQAFGDVPVLSKPFNSEQLETQLQQMMPA